MKKLCLLSFIFCCLFFRSYSQNNVVFNDSNYFKMYSYLQISIDQLNSGLLKEFRELKNNNAFADSIKIVSLKSTGLLNNLIAFKILMQYPKESKPFEYTFCYDEERKQLYKLKGFYNNDFIGFFDYLKAKGYKISSDYFSRKGITIESVDTECLIGLYQLKRKKIITELDRSTYDCLKYNMQPVITY